ncbi:heparin lyase I family protein [Streptomyces sp. NPDC102278]|uniref:heparin lyase I family protein n=1 Tax=Streptomyces sp. NPDC102278 TaxID=3366152 RepID=UPI00381AA693
MLRRYNRNPPSAALLISVVAAVTALIGAVIVTTPEPFPFSRGFVSGGTAQLSRESADAVTVVRAPGGRPGEAARFTLPDGPRSLRSAMVTGRPAYGSYRYTFANYLPTDWVLYRGTTITSQWHDGTDAGPAIALAVEGDRWVMDIHWHVDSGPIQEAKHDLGPVHLGHWNQWSFDITWSTATTPGSITARRDGFGVGLHRGPNNQQQYAAPYYKIGLYRPNRQPAEEHLKGGTPDVVIYYDDINITSLPPGTATPRPRTSPVRHRTSTISRPTHVGQGHGAGGGQAVAATGRPGLRGKRESKTCSACDRPR